MVSLLNLRIQILLRLKNCGFLRKENKIFYEATVFQQNNGKPISFELTAYSKNEMNFENKFHDFPKKMHYEFPDEQSMIVTVSNEEKKVIFNFKKIK
jgi:hypothetical protein